MRLLLIISSLLSVFSLNVYSQNVNDSGSNNFRLGLGITYGIDRFNESEIRELADDFNLVPYSSPVYEHSGALGINISALYQLTDLLISKMEISYIPGFKSNYTIFDVLIDYERAFFESDLFAVHFSPGIILNVDEKSDFYLFAGIGILNRNLKEYQEVRTNKSVISNINKREIKSTELLCSFSAEYSYNISSYINLFLRTNYNIGFGELSRSNFIQITSGASIYL